jgi:ribosomal protein L32
VALLYPALFLLGILLAYLALSLMAGRPLFMARGNAARMRREKKRKRRRGDTGAANGSLKTCPVCGTVLEKGQLVKSIVFQGGVKAADVTERMSHIFGCPFCYPANTRTPRICPVCGRIIPADGYLIARMFEKSGRERKHVHVLGCTVCRSR